MKIAAVHLNLSTESGDPRMFFHIVRGLADAGHEVIVFTAQFDASCFPDLHRGLRIVVAKSSKKLEAVFEQKGLLAKIFDRIRRERSYTKAAHAVFETLPKDLDVIICQNDPSYKFGIHYKKINPRARIVWIMNNAPWRHTKKNGFMMNLLSILASRWIRLIVKYKYVRGIDLVVVHDSEQEKLLEGFGLRAINLAIPIDFENFYMPPKKIDYREKAVLLGIGALSPVRKFEDIITAAGFLRKYGVDTRIILICKDFWKDTAYKELLRAAARKYDMEDSVEFYFSGVNEKELRAILKRSHFYVFPNHIKIWSMSSFEAMAAGLVLAVSSATSVADVLRDGENAVFFNPGDAEALAIKIRELVMKPTDYARIAAAGQEFVRQNLNWQNYTKRFADALMRT